MEIISLKNLLKEEIYKGDSGGEMSDEVFASLSIRSSEFLCDKISKTLRSGGVIMHATETCYGLAADIFNFAALERVYKLKKMNSSKPVSVMVRSLDEARGYADLNNFFVQLAEKFWPGPLTLVMPKKTSLPPFLNSGLETIGIRCPDYALCRDLIDLSGGPLCTTSANVSGVKEVYCVEDYLAQLSPGDEFPDLVLDSGCIPQHKPSTIVSGDPENVYKVIRMGDMADDIVRACERFKRG